MATDIVPFGGILHLPDALTKHPGMGVVCYDRMSSCGQAGGTGGPKLEARARATYQDAKRIAGKRLSRRFTFYGIELGQAYPAGDNPRPCLREAATYAEQNSCILAAPDLSRLVRAEKYSRRTANDLMPNQDDFDALYYLTKKVPLATILPPNLTESERHRERILRPGTAGRPRGINKKTAWKVVSTLGDWGTGNVGRKPGWERSIASVAKSHGISGSSIQRLLNAVVDGDRRLKHLMGFPENGLSCGFMWSIRESTKDAVYQAIQEVCPDSEE